MILLIIEGLIALVVIWIIANVLRALLHGITHGRGFWSIYESMITTKPKQQEERVKNAEKTTRK